MDRYCSDTDSSADKIYTRLMSKASISRKIGIIDELYLTALSMARMSVRKRYPAISEIDSRLKTAELILGESLARKVYGRE